MKATLWMGLLLAATLSWPVHAAVEEVEYIHTDALGTPLVATDENGNVVERFEYEPYGLQISGPVADGPGYTGHVEDAATGLTYMQQRYYDPQIGMFLSVDPVTAYGDPVGQFNRYRYANGNPYLYTDPDGRYIESAIDAASLAVGVHSLASNVSNGNWGAAAVDVAGLALDGAALAIPFVPGGAGLGIKMVREGTEVVGKAGDEVADVPATSPEGGGGGTIFVDSKGNALPGLEGATVTGSPDGKYIQVRDSSGTATGVRIDGGHKASTHPDPRAQAPHGHRPDATNDDGTPWLPIQE